MTKTVTTPYDVAEHLRTAEEMAAYLEACMEEAPSDAAFIAKALGDIARAKGMSEVAGASLAVPSRSGFAIMRTRRGTFVARERGIGHQHVKLEIAAVLVARLLADIPKPREAGTVGVSPVVLLDCPVPLRPVERV